MARPATLKVDIVADARGVSRGVDEAESSLGKLGKVGGAVGAAVVGGLALAGAAVGAFGISAFGAASRAEQSAGAIESVYGEAAASVEAYAQTSAQNLGLAASSYRELSSVVGSQLKNMGQSQTEAAGTSDELIRLGADLAATYGGDVSTAVEAVGSLLRGERDPIEQYGVSISAAAIEARLAADGLDHLTGAERKAAEAQATLALLTEQTAGAHGAFAREAGTAAGSSAILSAKFEDVKARLATGLLPAFATAATYLADRVLPGAERVASALAANLGPAITTVSTFVTSRIIPAAQQFYSWWAERIAPFLLGAARTAFDGLRSAFENVTGAIDRNRPQLESLLRGFRNVAQFVAENLYPVIATTLGTAFRIAGTAISNALDNIGNLVNAFIRVKNAVQGAIDTVRNFRVPNLGGFFSGSTGALLEVGAPRLVGPAGPGGGLAGLATAAGSTDLAGALLAGAAGARGTVLVDRSDHRVSVRVDGALDPAAVARQLERVLADHARRTGRAPSFGVA